jgi:hypothetical protein
LRDPIAAAYARAHTPRDVALTVATFAAAAAVAARGDLVATLPQHCSTHWARGSAS